GGAGRLRQLLGMLDERLGLAFHEGQEVLAAQVEGAIDPGVEGAVAAEGEVALEDQAIVAAQDRYNRRGELLRKAGVRGHGVLLPRRSLSQPLLDSRTPGLLTPCGCGDSRVKQASDGVEVPRGLQPAPADPEA